jgi:hypothetical protein
LKHNLKSLSEDADEFDEENDGLRNYDNDYNPNDQFGFSNDNDDEFFLISTPSPLNLGAVVSRVDETPKSFDLIEPNNDYEDIINNNFKPQSVVLRYQPQYDLNRLSNITEEDTNFEDDENKQTNDLEVIQINNSKPVLNINEINSNEKNKTPSESILIDSINSNKDIDDENVNHLDSRSVNNFKEILMLGEKVSNLYNNIENELLEPSLTAPTSNYKPLMKKRVYSIKNSLDEKNGINKEEYSCQSKKQISNIDNLFLQPQKLIQESEEDPDSILNYLIGRLSEQHKAKLGTFYVMPINKDSQESKINTKNTILNIEEIRKNDLPFSTNENTATQILDKVKICDLKNSSFESNILMTKSLYAQHKQINLKKEIENTSNQFDKNNQKLEKPINQNNKVITALSINEIETTNMFKINHNSSISFDEKKNHSEINSNKHNLEKNNDEDSIGDEKKIKEEILLIGEKKDIESLLENENSELYNLIIENSNRTNTLSTIENDLNRKRIELIKNENSDLKMNSNDRINKKDIGILIEDEEVDNYFIEKNSLDNEIKDTAKYLVGEITKISLNKMKIDELSDKLSKKYFSNNLFTKHEILNNLTDSNSQGQLLDMNKSQINKTREELYDYYSNLEKNLEQVRNEIDKLKKEAYDDLAYFSEVLSANDLKEKLIESSSNDLIDYDQVYLKNDDDNVSETFENRIDNLKLKKSDSNFQKNLEIENDEDTQYLSQPTSIASTITSNAKNNNYVSNNKINTNSICDNLNKNYNENNNDYSQAYLTPAESWQTLINDNKSINSDKNNLNSVKENEHVNKPSHDENQTDLDEDELMK